MADEDESPVCAKAASTAVGHDQRQRGSDARHGDRHHQQLLNRARERILALGQHVGRRNAEQQVARQARHRKLHRQQHRRAVVIQHLHHPLRGEAAGEAQKIILRDARQHRQHYRHNQEGAHAERERQLQPEPDRAAHAHRFAPYPAAATDEPVSERANANAAQVIAPSTNDNAAAIATLACSVNSV